MNDIIILWSILGVAFTFIYMDNLSRFYVTIKHVGKRVLFVVIFAALGGPIILVLACVAMLLISILELFCKLVEPMFTYHVIEPLKKWFQK